MKIIKCNKRFYLRTYENISSGRFTKSGKEIMKTLNTTKRNSTSKDSEDFFETQDKTIDVLWDNYLKDFLVYLHLKSL